MGCPWLPSFPSQYPGSKVTVYQSGTMTRGLASLLSFLLSISSIISALPSQGPSLSTRQEDGCTSTDPEAVYDSSCWESLDLTNWLTNWKPPKICNGHDLGIGCCQENEFWSTCFLRLGMGHSGFDCSQIQANTNNCAFSDLIASDLDPKERAQYRYILKTIFSMLRFLIRHPRYSR